MFKRLYQVIKYEYIALKNIGKSGLLIPTSKYTIDMMLEGVINQNTKVVLELGAGNGNITRRILEQLPEDALLISFEISEECLEFLNEIKDKRLFVVKDSAEFASKYIQSVGVEKCDAIISTLPLSVFSLEVRDKIMIELCKVMSDDCILVQMRYFSLKVRKQLRKTFVDTKSKYSYLNLPPTFLHFCSKPKI